MLVTRLLAPLGDAAPWIWLLLARAAGIGAVVVAGRLAWRVAPAVRVPAGLAAGIGLTLTVGVARGVALGYSEGLLVLCLLLAVERHVDGRDDQAFRLATLAALLDRRPGRSCSSPRSSPGSASWWRAGVACGLLGVPVPWFLPELWGSGSRLRSAERAVIVEPGAPALADIPRWNRWGGSPCSPRSHSGSGRSSPPSSRSETRTACWRPSSRRAGLGGDRRRDGPGRLLRRGSLPHSRRGRRGGGRVGRLEHGARADAASGGRHSALPDRARAPAVRRRAGDRAREGSRAGRSADRRHRAGRRYRRRPVAARRLRQPGGRQVPLPRLAWRLGVPISALSLEPRPPGVVLRSRHRPGEPPEPAVPAGYRTVAVNGRWEVLSTCV